MEKKEREKRDRSEIATKIMAIILVILMIVGFASTLIYYLVNLLTNG